MPRPPEQKTIPERYGADEKIVTPNSEPRRKQKEINGPAGPEPTRYGDWERKGRCIDF